MACRIGMSKYPLTRIQHWKDTEGHTYGKILHENKTYDRALALERAEAAARNCHSAGGGPRDNASDWAVYYVSGGTIK